MDVAILKVNNTVDIVIKLFLLISNAIRIEFVAVFSAFAIRVVRVLRLSYGSSDSYKTCKLWLASNV